MGLDITAYKKLKKVDNPILDKDGYPEDWNNYWKPGAGMLWSESIWQGRGYPINPELVYEWEDLYEFRAGSYIGYDIWREHLKNFKGNEAFQELINFADNEGVIGTDVSKKLRDDFQRFQDEAEEFSTTCTLKWFMKSYLEWKKAFEYASDNGAVEFG